MAEVKTKQKKIFRTKQAFLESIYEKIKVFKSRGNTFSEVAEMIYADYGIVISNISIMKTLQKGKEREAKKEGLAGISIGMLTQNEDEQAMPMSTGLPSLDETFSENLRDMESVDEPDFLLEQIDEGITSLHEDEDFNIVSEPTYETNINDLKKKEDTAVEDDNDFIDALELIREDLKEYYNNPSTINLSVNSIEEKIIASVSEKITRMLFSQDDQGGALRAVSHAAQNYMLPVIEKFNSKYYDSDGDFFVYSEDIDILKKSLFGSIFGRNGATPSSLQAEIDNLAETLEPQIRDLTSKLSEELSKQEAKDFLLDDRFKKEFKEERVTALENKIDILAEKYYDFMKSDHQKDVIIDKLSNLLERMDERLEKIERMGEEENVMSEFNLSAPLESDKNTRIRDNFFYTDEDEIRETQSFGEIEEIEEEEDEEEKKGKLEWLFGNFSHRSN